MVRPFTSDTNNEARSGHKAKASKPEMMRSERRSLDRVAETSLCAGIGEYGTLLYRELNLDVAGFDANLTPTAPNWDQYLDPFLLFQG